ncbi:hypothetical protein [Luteibacter sp.]|uniref:hypothetical protein n=1 Tax=Luteibacter sp. TaxID=1886636 RepID=UPI00280715B2|nr:hypothetical protein [Luteibacter sp.]MDQ8050853.1 hypothetical protein [Luteibacter sp.]
MTANRPGKNSPAKQAGAKKRELDQIKKMPVSKLPVVAGGDYSLTPNEEDWLTSLLAEVRLEKVINLLGDEEREIIKKGIGAAVSFRHLVRLIEDVESSNDIGEWTKQEVLHNLEITKAGFKIAMGIAESALAARSNVILKAITSVKVAAAARWENDPAGRGMREVKMHWDSWQAGQAQYASDAAFARAMSIKYPQIRSEGSIKNAVGKWRKSEKSSS